MKNFDKHEFDNIFRAGLTAPDLNEIDEDWALMKTRLQNQMSRKSIPFYMIWISSVAAVLLKLNLAYTLLKKGKSSIGVGAFFGIANLNLSYKMSLANNVKLAFNPYLKLPITDLGNGNIRLRAAGMSVGVITNLNKNKNS